MYEKKDLGPGFDMKNPADPSQSFYKVCGGRGAVEGMCKSTKGCDAYTL